MYQFIGNNFLSVSKTGENEQKVITIISIFHQIPAASAKFIETLCRLVLQTEKSVMVIFIQHFFRFRNYVLSFYLFFRLSHLHNIVCH